MSETDKKRRSESGNHIPRRIRVESVPIGESPILGSTISEITKQDNDEVTELSKRQKRGSVPATNKRRGSISKDRGSLAELIQQPLEESPDQLKTRASSSDKFNLAKTRSGGKSAPSLRLPPGLQEKKPPSRSFEGIAESDGNRDRKKEKGERSRSVSKSPAAALSSDEDEDDITSIAIHNLSQMKQIIDINDITNPKNAEVVDALIKISELEHRTALSIPANMPPLPTGPTEEREPKQRPLLSLLDTKKLTAEGLQEAMTQRSMKPEKTRRRKKVKSVTQDSLPVVAAPEPEEPAPDVLLRSHIALFSQLLAQNSTTLEKIFDGLTLSQLEQLKSVLSKSIEARRLEPIGVSKSTSLTEQLVNTPKSQADKHKLVHKLSSSWVDEFAWDAKKANSFPQEAKIDSPNIKWTPTENQGQFELTSATVPGLIEICLSDIEDLKRLVPTVVVTHDHFLSASELLQKFIEALGPDLNKVKASGIQMLYVFKQWFKHNPGDFGEESPALPILNNFLKSLTASFPTWGAMMRRWFEDGTASTWDPFVEQLFTWSNLGPEVPSPNGILDFPPVEIALQLTLKDHFLFRKMPCNELLNKRYEKPERSPHLHNFTTQSNWISEWVTTEILCCKDPKRRLKLMSHLTAVAKHLYELKNFGAFMTFILGLNCSAITRLKAYKTAPGVAAQMEKWISLINPSGNFKIYRSLVDEAKPPMIPCMALILKDLTFMDDGNDTFDPENKSFIKLDKLFMIGKVIARVEYLRSVKYMAPANINLEKYFANCVLIPNIERNQRSLALEPNEPK